MDKSYATVVGSRPIGYKLVGPAYDDILKSRLFDYISRCSQLWTEQRTVAADLTYNRQFGFRETVKISRVNGRNVPGNYPCRIVLSWLGSSDLDQADTMHVLAGIKCRAFPPDPLWPRILALLELRNVWRGPRAVDENRQLVPLQFLLPNDAFMHWWVPGIVSVPDGPLSPLRIICTHRSERIEVSQIRQQQLVFHPIIVATFDLGLTATARLLSQRSLWASPYLTIHGYASTESLDMTWFGTAAEYSACLRTILNDIWADYERQLDVWQKLYALTCVKPWNKCMWKIGDEAEVATWQSDDVELHTKFARGDS